jgi:hypothetical protein
MKIIKLFPVLPGLMINNSENARQNPGLFSQLGYGFCAAVKALGNKNFTSNLNIPKLNLKKKHCNYSTRFKLSFIF